MYRLTIHFGYLTLKTAHNRSKSAPLKRMGAHEAVSRRRSFSFKHREPEIRSDHFNEIAYRKVVLVKDAISPWPRREVTVIVPVPPNEVLIVVASSFTFMFVADNQLYPQEKRRVSLSNARFAGFRAP